MRTSIFLWYTLIQAISLTYAQVQPSDGDNLESFPSIVNPSSSSTSVSSSSRGVFSSPSLGPGPAISPSSYLSSTLPPTATAAPSGTTTRGNQTTLVSASASNYTDSQPVFSIATSTVSGSVTTLTITNSAASQATGTSGAARSSKPEGNFRIWAGTAVALGTVGLCEVMFKL
ncbi:uncharacterized protein JCM6883_004030 [Sporobolomyces salmoneus]|uniref:uncharacterized protein n=1 Tax=Sporobolomyces salmoneus TaxID=183962 RepID=UPI003171B332